MPGQQDDRVGIIWVALLYSVAWTILTSLLLDKRQGCR
jgi:hypothetical protein